MHGKSRVKKVMLGHRVTKVRENRVSYEKVLIKCKAQGHMGHEAPEAQSP